MISLKLKNLENKDSGDNQRDQGLISSARKTRRIMEGQGGISSREESCRSGAKN